MGLPYNCPTCSIEVILDKIVAMHMRPVSLLVKVSRQFESDVFIEYNDRKADAKSLLDIITLGIPGGAIFTISAIGADASRAISTIKMFFKRLLCDEIGEDVKSNKIMSLSENMIQTAKVEKEVGMMGKKKTQKKATAKECSVGKCQSGYETKKKTGKTHKFSWPAESEAGEVCLAGDFNNWIPEPMTRQGREFQALMVLAPGEYQYKFIVDGQWIPDPNAIRFEPNVFCSVNSVVIVC